MSIESSAQNRWLYELLLLNGLKQTHVWIGLDDIDVEGSFQWIDGSLTGQTFFCPSQPDNHRSNEHCAMYWGDAASDCWNDWPCNEKIKSICRWRSDKSKHI